MASESSLGDGRSIDTGEAGRQLMHISKIPVLLITLSPSGISSTMARSPVPPSGIYTPLVTFFKPDSSLDLPSIEAHALRMARGKLVGLVLQGSNGEAVHLDNEE